MLHVLYQYANRKLDIKIGVTPKDVRWAIFIDSHGRTLAVHELGDVDSRSNRGKRFNSCPELTFSEMKSGGITKSHFLVDTADVVALYTKGDPDEKTLQKHDYFINLLRKASVIMPSLEVPAHVLEDDSKLSEVRQRLEDHGAKPTDKVTVNIDGDYPVESDDWYEWWMEFKSTLKSGRSKAGGKKKTAMMRCFATGELAAPTRVSPKIPGLADVGGMSAGDALISFKQESFCSYGLSQAANAAVSEPATKAYNEALKELLSDHSYKLAGAKIVYWYSKSVPKEHDPLHLLGNPEDISDEYDSIIESSALLAAKSLLDSIRSGEYPQLEGNRFYAATLSGAAGRVMVRDWMEGEFEALVENVASWFDDLQIVHRDGSRIAPAPKFMAVLGSTVRDLKELVSPFVTAMWRAALHRNESIPRFAASKALLRMRTEIIRGDPANHARMGLLKAYHNRNIRFKGGEMNQQIGPYLSEDHPNPAYHCGRLLAVLAKLQRTALPGVEAGVVQRYYAAASATPALVLGRLVRTSNFHMNKIESKGLVHWYENVIADIWTRISEKVPSTLSLEDQTTFALGYYQQLASMNKKQTKPDEKEENNE